MQKKVWIITSCILIFLIGILFFLSFALKIKLESQNIEVAYKTQFVEPGYHASFLGKDLTNLVQVIGNMDTSQLGEYTIIYTVKYGFFSTKAIRYVNVVDKESPQLLLKGSTDINLCPNTVYQEEGYEAYDNYDGDITDKVIVTNYDDKIDYTVSDSSHNEAKQFRKINYQDIEKPTITLKGLSTIYINKGSSYIEPGYVTNDNCKEVEVKINGNVDTKNNGTYTITYQAIDKSGNESIITRKVIVFEPSNSNSGKAGVIYLTFDDGPNVTTTGKILDILKEQGVQATFFVTSQYGNTDALLKREYQEGHTIGLHSYSHRYSQVYASIDAYYQDLYAMQKRVKEVTGYESYITRFPGGSSNTVSRNYTNGIMSYLTKDILTKGFHYFDWNVASNDTACSTSGCVYNNVVNSLSKSRGNYILMHDVKTVTLNALQDIILYGKANGYVFEAITMSTPMNHHAVNN